MEGICEPVGVVVRLPAQVDLRARKGDGERKREKEEGGKEVRYTHVKGIDNNIQTMGKIYRGKQR